MADRPRKGKRGRKSYKKRGRPCLRVARSQAVTPVFGQIKDARAIDRFMRRGLSAAAGESKPICATHNLLKLFRSGQANCN